MFDLKHISEWTRIDNLPFYIGSELEYIREDAECLGNVEEWEIFTFTREKLETDYPQLFREHRFEDVVEIEYYPFEKDEEEDFTGYAVYIYFHKDLVVKMIKHVLEVHPDYVIKFLQD